jgi:hypothetical protein
MVVSVWFFRTKKDHRVELNYINERIKVLRKA